MRKLLLYLGAACIVVLTLASMPRSHVKAGNGSIVGTWITIAALDTPPGSPPFVETELAAINPGGTITLTSAVFNAHGSGNPFLQPFLIVDASDGYGAWKQEADSNLFDFTFKRLLFAGARTPIGLYGSFFVGQNVGVVTIQAILSFQHSVDGDTLVGPFTFQVTNLGGAIIGTGSGTVSATRLKIEPLTP